jgi:hypothetical protein
MKRLFTLALLSLSAASLTTGHASAWPCWFDKCCNKKNCATLCIKPYNAFSPVCFGSICCDGCFPLSVHGGHRGSPYGAYGPYGACGPQGMCGPMWGDGGLDGCDSCAVSQLPAPDTALTGTPQVLPGTNPPNSPPPAPATVPTGTVPTSQAWPNVLPYGMIQAGYQPAYYPGYNYAAPVQAVPWYWNAGGR